MERADAGLRRRHPPDRSGRCELASIHSAVSTARRRSRAASGPALRGLPETTSTKRLASTWPISSRPMSLLPSAAACASSPSTISSGSGGTDADLPGRLAVADRLHQFGREEERQALVAADVVMGAGIFVAGMADQHRSRHQFAELAAAVQAETALAHIGDRVAAMLLRERLVAGPRACSGSRKRKWICARAAWSRSSRRFRYARRGGATGSSTSNRVLLVVGWAPSIDSSRRLEMAPPFGEILSA